MDHICEFCCEVVDPDRIGVPTCCKKKILNYINNLKIIHQNEIDYIREDCEEQIDYVREEYEEQIDTIKKLTKSKWMGYPTY